MAQKNTLIPDLRLASRLLDDYAALVYNSHTLRGKFVGKGADEAKAEYEGLTSLARRLRSAARRISEGKKLYEGKFQYSERTRMIRAAKQVAEWQTPRALKGVERCDKLTLRQRIEWAAIDFGVDANELEAALLRRMKRGK